MAPRGRRVVMRGAIEGPELGEVTVWTSAIRRPFLIGSGGRERSSAMATMDDPAQEGVRLTADQERKRVRRLPAVHRQAPVANGPD